MSGYPQFIPAAQTATPVDISELSLRGGPSSGGYSLVALTESGVDEVIVFQWDATSVAAPVANQVIQPAGFTVGRHIRKNGGNSAILGGDTIGPSGGNTVVALRGTSLSSTSPVAGQVPFLTGSAYVPTRVQRENTHFIDDFPNIRKNDNTFDNGPGIQAAINTLGGLYGCKLIFGYGDYYVATPIYIIKNTTSIHDNNIVQLELIGCGRTTGSGFDLGSRLIWNGNNATNGCIFWVYTQRCRFTELIFGASSSANKNAYAFIAFSKTDPAETHVAVTEMIFDRCEFEAGQGYLNGSRINYGVVFGDPVDEGVGAGNFENMQFYNCRFNNFYYAGTMHAAGTQPYKIHYENCTWTNFTAPANHTAGEGVQINTPSSSFLFLSCEWSVLTRGVALNNNVTSIVMINCQSESCKRVYGGGFNSAVTQAKMIGCRWSAIACGYTGDHPQLPIGPSDTDYISHQVGGGLSMDTVDFSSGYVAAARINFWTAGLSANNCTFPNTAPFTFGNASNCAGSRTDNCGGYNSGGTVVPLTQVFTGGRNVAGTAVITGAATSVDVTFPVPTPEVAGYQVYVTVSDATSGAVIGTPYTLSAERLTTKFTIRLTTAPTGTESVTVSYSLTRG